MSVKQSFLGAVSASQLYVDDVFNVTLRNGTGSSATVTTGNNLSTNGGLVVSKARSTTTGWRFTDTARGATKSLDSSSTAAEVTEAQGITAFNSNGHTVGTDADYNDAAQIFVDYEFRKAEKFFDVVTWTGDGAATRWINHSLGIEPGFFVTKILQTTGSWITYHRSLGSSVGQALNLTNATVVHDWVNNPTSSQFCVPSNVNSTGQTYVAYLFAHDTATDGIIQCGSYTGTGTSQNINLGFEAQWVLVKKATGTTANWFMQDVMRGMPLGVNNATLYANQSNAESAVIQIWPHSSGFTVADASATVNESGQTYIYLAIRRSNKPPTSGTQVFMPTVYTGTNGNNYLVNTTIAPDLVIARQRSNATNTGMTVGSRLTGQQYMFTGATSAETNSSNGFDQQLVGATEYGTAFSAMNGFWVGNSSLTKLNQNSTSNDQVALAFKRAVGVFDEVCFTAGAAPNTVPHGLGSVPEMIITKRRNTSGEHWYVYHSALGATKGLYLSLSDSEATSSAFWSNTAPTATQFTAGSNHTNGATYIARLFATKAGISKVGSYTGNGTSQTINCGFTTGARFVLLKDATNAGTNWFLYDSARGIVAGNDPFLYPNLTDAEITTTDYIDPDNSGFIINGQHSTNGATYIYLAFA